MGPFPMEKKETKPHEFGVPGGDYCYAYVPSMRSGFKTMKEVDQHLEKMFGDDEENFINRLRESNRVMSRRFCRYYRYHEGIGTVECTYLHRRALALSATEEEEKKAIEFFGGQEEFDKHVTSWALGDALKECGLNRDIETARFPPGDDDAPRETDQYFDVD